MLTSPYLPEPSYLASQRPWAAWPLALCEERHWFSQKSPVKPTPHEGCGGTHIPHPSWLGWGVPSLLHGLMGPDGASGTQSCAQTSNIFPEAQACPMQPGQHRDADSEPGHGLAALG